MGDLESALERMRAAEAPAMELITQAPPAPPRSVALLSGSFDPVTVGHVALAQAALASSECVLFVYSVRTLPKGGPSASEEPMFEEHDRLRALIGLCERTPRFAAAVCSRGLLVEQAVAAADLFAPSELSLVMGSDKLLQLFDPRWYGDVGGAISTLMGRATVRYAPRSGDENAVAALLEREDVRAWRDRLQSLEVPPEVGAVSSTRVRELIRSGKDVRDLMPPGGRTWRRGSGHG